MLESNKRIFWSAILAVKIKDIRGILKKIFENKKKYFENKEIWIFGSLLERKFVGGSDIDILIGPFNKKLTQEEIAKVKIKLLEGIPWYYNIQIHVLDDHSKDFFKNIKKERLEKFLST